VEIHLVDNQEMRTRNKLNRKSNMILYSKITIRTEELLLK
jgi:hypothetical protein